VAEIRSAYLDKLLIESKMSANDRFDPSTMTSQRYPDHLLDGRHLRSAREAAGLKQEELAAAARLHTNSLRYWERHVTEPHGVAVSRLLDALQQHGVWVAVNIDSYGAIAVIERRQ
jgi:DNA-binding transcriptional regulator YiaG